MAKDPGCLAYQIAHCPPRERPLGCILYKVLRSPVGLRPRCLQWYYAHQHNLLAPFPSLFHIPMSLLGLSKITFLSASHCFCLHFPAHSCQLFIISHCLWAWSPVIHLLAINCGNPSVAHGPEIPGYQNHQDLASSPRLLHFLAPLSVFACPLFSSLSL